MDSVRWILDGQEQGIHVALRFENKYSQKNTKLEGEYTRQVQYVWSRHCLDSSLDDAMEIDAYERSPMISKRRKK